MGLIADEQPAIADLLDTAGRVHGKGMQSYLTMMAVRLLELRRVLKPTGSIYLHCDPTASHYLKMLMDAVFGQVASSGMKSPGTERIPRAYTPSTSPTTEISSFDTPRERR